MKKCIIFLLLLSGWIPRLFSQKTYSLEEILKLAHSNNLLIKISQTERQIAVENYRNQKNLENPEIEYSRGTGKLFDTSEKRTLWELGFKLPLPNPVTRHYLLKKQKNLITVSDLEKTIQMREVTQMVKYHYFMIQLGEKLKNYLNDQINILNDVCRITQERVQQGEAVELDHLRTITEKQMKQTELFRIEKSIAHEKNKMIEILNFSMPDHFSIEPDFNFSPLPDIKQKIETNIQENIWVRVKKNLLESKKNQLQASRSNIFESIEIFAHHESEVEAKIWKFGVGLSIPLFKKRSDSRLSKLEMEKALLEWEHTKKHLLADIYQKVSHIRILEKEITTFNDNIMTLGQKNVALSKTMYLSGEISLLSHLDVQNSFFNTMSRFYQAVSEWKTLKAELVTLLGEEL